MQEDPLAGANQRVLQGGARFLKRHTLKAVGRVAKHAIRSILIHTAPVWGPVVIMLLLAVTAYMLIYGMAKEASMLGVPDQAKVGAFFNTEDKEIIQKNEHLFDEYKTVANTWDEGLSPEQKKQVMAYKFPWSVMAAMDRVVNDESAWGIGKGVNPKPQSVFDALRPRFTWRDSTITTTTVTCHYQEPDAEGKGGGTVCSTSTQVQPISLLTAADTFEGHFAYTYETKTTTTTKNDGGSTTVTREVVKQITPPQTRYVPLKQYMEATRGIRDEGTFDIVENLAMVYNSEYLFDVGLQFGQNFATRPAYALAYAEAVQQALLQHPNVPQPLFLALIAHESGGNWRAVNNANINSTVDAGLCQINSVNWANYGLTDNPYDVSRNMNAGMSIIGRNLAQYGDFKQALYAYNGGTPSNGMKYNPTYAPAVMSIFAQLQSTRAYAQFIPAISDQPMTILAAEQAGEAWQAYGQSGKNLINPPEITVINERTGETKRVPRTSGNDTMWAREAWVYYPEFVDMQKGDTLTIQFPDGETANIGGK